MRGKMGATSAICLTLNLCNLTLNNNNQNVSVKKNTQIECLFLALFYFKIVIKANSFVSIDVLYIV